MRRTEWQPVLKARTPSGITVRALISAGHFPLLPLLQPGRLRGSSALPSDTTGAGCAHLPWAHRLRLQYPGGWSGGRADGGWARTWKGQASRMPCTYQACARSRDRGVPVSHYLQSEVVVPVLTPDGGLLAVLDVDSGAWCNFPAACYHTCRGCTTVHRQQSSNNCNWRVNA